jgi:hypothetical protein
MRVLDFSTFFSYIGSDGEQTISSAQFIADTNLLSRNTSDSLLTFSPETDESNYIVCGAGAAVASFHERRA